MKAKKISKIAGLKPTGSQVLVELLNEDEMLGTTLHLPKGGLTASSGRGMEAPQAIVLAVGPKYNKQDYGFEVGDRIMFSGQFVPAPNYDDYYRSRGTIEPHSVKAILNQE